MLKMISSFLGEAKLIARTLGVRYLVLWADLVHKAFKVYWPEGALYKVLSYDCGHMSDGDYCFRYSPRNLSIYSSTQKVPEEPDSPWEWVHGMIQGSNRKLAWKESVFNTVASFGNGKASVYFEPYSQAFQAKVTYLDSEYVLDLINVPTKEEAQVRAWADLQNMFPKPKTEQFFLLGYFDDSTQIDVLLDVQF